MAFYEKHNKAQRKADGRVLTPWFRVAWPELFEPEDRMNNGANPKYSVTMLFDPDKVDISEIENLIEDTIKNTWPKKVPNLRPTIRDGDEKGYDGFEGKVFVKASTKFQPGLVDSDLTDILDSKEIYGGCYARATVSAYSYNKAGNAGVSLNLLNFQKLADGEPFATRIEASDDFADSDDDTGQIDHGDFDL